MLHRRMGGDTWHGVRFVEEWADPASLAALSATYAVHERADVERALQAAMDLDGRLAGEVADRAGLAYPAEEKQFARRLVDAATASAR
jgi:aminoglycoside 6-adenylyltransferase